MTAPLSVQLYSLRAEAAQDFPAVLERVARAGYVGVEPAGFHDLTATEFRKQLDACGLEVSSAHAQPPVGRSANEILDTLETIGTRNLVVAYLPPEHFTVLDDLKKSADKLNAAHENAKARGVHLGYHNHFWEFSSRIDGRCAYDVFYEMLDPGIFAEVDLYWAKVGGADPVSVLEKMGDRVRFVHVKDGPADAPESDMTAVGEGVLDMQKILAACPNVAWHIVELDRCATDMFEAIEKSAAYLVGQGLSRGKA